MRCRRCGQELRADPDLRLGVRANRYERLVFRCERCHVGYSNALREEDRIEITATPEENVPAEVQPGLSETLAGAANVDARSGKRWKFCSEHSEDAATWTVIRGLQLTNQLAQVRLALGLDSSAGAETPEVLFWGVPSPDSGDRGPHAAGVLRQISDDLGEKARRRSEPDAVLIWSDLVVVIEAKLDSGNDRQTRNLDRFDRYLGRADLWSATPAEIKEAGFYELVRNWVIAWELADRTGARHSVLVNLAPALHAADVEYFRRLVNPSDARRIEHLRWASLLPDEIPGWLEDYVARLGMRGADVGSADSGSSLRSH